MTAGVHGLTSAPLVVMWSQHSHRPERLQASEVNEGDSPPEVGNNHHPENSEHSFVACV